MKFCWTCFNGFNQGEAPCPECQRPGGPLPAWAAWLFAGTLAASAAASVAIPRLFGVPYGAAEQWVMIATLPVFAYLTWKLH